MQPDFSALQNSPPLKLTINQKKVELGRQNSEQPLMTNPTAYQP